MEVRFYLNDGPSSFYTPTVAVSARVSKWTSRTCKSHNEHAHSRTRAHTRMRTQPPHTLSTLTRRALLHTQKNTYAHTYTFAHTTHTPIHTHLRAKHICAQSIPDTYFFVKQQQVFDCWLTTSNIWAEFEAYTSGMSKYAVRSTAPGFSRNVWRGSVKNNMLRNNSL